VKKGRKKEEREEASKEGRREGRQEGMNQGGKEGTRMPHRIYIPCRIKGSRPKMLQKTLKMLQRFQSPQCCKNTMQNVRFQLRNAANTIAKNANEKFEFESVAIIRHTMPDEKFKLEMCKDHER
jgi:flagellar biosynthesis/type III secretory pathway protein FliH